MDKYLIQIGAEKPASEVYPNGNQLFESGEGGFHYALFIQGWREALETVVGALNDIHAPKEVLVRLKYIPEPRQVYFGQVTKDD